MLVFFWTQSSPTAYSKKMVRLFTVAALLLWLVKPSCAICCVEARSAGQDRGTDMVGLLTIADDCCPGSDAERGIPSARTCCLLDEYSNSLAHSSTDSHDPGTARVVERPLLTVGALHGIPLAHQPSLDPGHTHLKHSVLLI